MEKTTAEVILQQLGGQRFIVMTGARNLISNTERERGALTMKLPRGMTRNGITHVRITLTADDLYTLEGLKVRGVNCSTEFERAGVYADNLQAAFTEMTGLDTHL